MTRAIKIALIGAVAVLLLDTVASILAVSFNLAYGWFSIGSFLLYLVFGYWTGRTSKWFVGGLVGVFMSIVESTFGWAISWYIGPGELTSEINPLVVGITIAFVMIVGAILGLAGGALSLLKQSDA